MFSFHEIQKLHALIREAGEATLLYHKKNAGITYKTDDSPLTLADIASHQILMKGLHQLFPHIPVVSEEGDAPHSHNLRYFTIDPIDGTKEFIKGSDEFVICIALIDDNYPIYGLIFAPATQQLWDSTLATLKPLQGNKAFVSRSHLDSETENYILQHGFTPIACGSALKFGLLLEGIASTYPRFGPTCPWDIAAGQAILEAAGGKVLDLKGQRLRYTGEKDERLPHFIATRP